MNRLYYLKNSFESQKINKDTLNKVIKEFNKDINNLKANFDNNIFTKFNKTIFLLKYTFVELIKELKTNKDIINLFNFSNNDKVKGSIISFNYSPYLFCPNCLNGTCNLNKKCYSNKQELAYKIKNNKLYCYSLINTLSNYIFLYYSMYSNSTNSFLYRAFEVNKKQLKNKSIIRFNNKADIKDQTILNYFNNMFILLKKGFNINKAYTYTKTKNLNYSKIHKDFIINKSYGLLSFNEALKTLNNNFNSYITIDPLEFESNKQIILKLYKDNKLNLCSAVINESMNNSCTNCLNNCYNKHDNITITKLH